MNGKPTYQLTHPQKRVFYTSQIFPGSPMYNIGGYVRINQKIDFKLLERSVNLYIKNNDGLRLKFKIDEDIVQYFEDYTYINLEYKDFSAFRDSEECFYEWMKQEIKKQFNIKNDFLFKIYLFKLAENDNGYLVKCHHIIADGWSIEMMSEIVGIYERLLKCEKEGVVPASSYLDYIKKEQNYINSNKFYKNKEYWNEIFKDKDSLENILPLNSIEGKRKTYETSENISKKIAWLSKELGCSLNTVFTALYAIYEYKAFGHLKIPIGTLCFNRSGKKERKIFGMCTSTISCVFNVDSKCDVKTLMKDYHRLWLNGYKNQEYPYDFLINDLELQKKGINSLFNVCINYYSGLDIKLDGLRANIYQFYNGYQPYSLQIIIRKWNGKLYLDFDYKISEYSELEIDEIYNCLSNLVDQIYENPEVKVKNLNLLSDDSFKKLIYDFNNKKFEYPYDKTVVEFFEQQAKNNPKKVALSFKKEKLDYKSLDEKSNQLANLLIKKGIKLEEKIGIITTHSIETVVAILSVLKAGGAYVPIDLNYPNERIEYIIEDSKISILLTNVSVGFLDFKGEIINLLDGDFCNEPTSSVGRKSCPNNLAYIIYTSGSTGNPKAVMVEHKGLSNYIYWAKTKYVKDENDVFALYSSLSFDLTVTSIFTPLISGCEIAIYRDDDESEYVLYKILREQKATIVKLTPSHLLLLQDLDNRNSSIRVFIVGGENLKVSVAKNVYDSFSKDLEIYNEYGPTETVVGCMIYKFDPMKDKTGSVPIGVPINNTQIYVLNCDLQPLPLGYTGEMYIGGYGVARGYANRLELTNEKFIDNPFVPGTKMYKTGDLAKFLNFDEIEYIGRADSQVKINGFRIELGEIEKAISNYENIKDVVITVIDNQNSKALCAYFGENKKVDILDLKNYLASILPEYMIPLHFIKMDQFPFTNNGKVDKKLLPKPEEFVSSNDNSNKNLNYEETVLIEVISKVLGAKTVGLNDNFYYIGGDSIKAIQISSKMNSKGFKLPVKDILGHPKISDMASFIQYDKTKNILQEDCIGEIKNTPIISWFFYQNFENRNHYTQSIVLDVKIDVPQNILQEMLDMLIKRHDALRINFDAAKNSIYYNPKYLNLKNQIIYFDISNDDDQEKAIGELGEKIKAKFDIENGLLFKIVIFNLGGSYKWLITAHHLIMDGISLRIIINDIEQMLKQFLKGKELKLENKTSSYAKWSDSLWQLDCDSKSFWDDTFKSKFKFSNGSLNSEVVNISKVNISGSLDKNNTNLLMTKANAAYGTKANDLLIAALFMTIKDLTNQTDILVSIEGHGREELFENIDISQTVGWFTTIYPVRMILSNDSLRDSIIAVKEKLRNLPNNGLDFSLLKYIKKEIDYSLKDLIRFNFLGSFDEQDQKDNISKLIIQDTGCDSDVKNSLTCLLDINCIEVKGKLFVYITFDSTQFEKSYIQDFMEKYFEVLKLIIEHCINKNETEFTSSDFSESGLAQEDLDALFDM